MTRLAPLLILFTAMAAQAAGHFRAEIAPYTVRVRRPGGADGMARSHERVVDADEGPRADSTPEKLAALKPAFAVHGSVTAGNASGVNDGSCALLLADEATAGKYGLTPRARILGHATFADKPNLFPTAPIGSVRKLMERTGLSVADIDLWEINEAFAVVAMAAMRDLGLGHDIVNVNGGACALGHPIGASGARVMVTLLNALEHHGLNRGIASLCIGGGEATAVAIERLN